MSDRMTPIPFAGLLDWMLTERETKGTVFGVHRPYQAGNGTIRRIFGRNLETPVGPAAGPHTQLAQNIVAAYYAGSRFFELKTVQILDGEDLPVNKPCIKADDECYNCEWSTELRVSQAMEEYIKAWFLLHVLAKEYGLGSAGGFQFNMSVGYDLDGIKEEKVNTFIDCMMDASGTAIFAECRTVLLDHLHRFARVTREDIEAIPAAVCNSATLSTLHGCPPQEIERIAAYLIEEKGLHTFIKCNPTLLGYEFARETLDSMGYDYIAFGDFHFKDDLQYEDAVPMLHRLMGLCEKKGLEFGVKITNTFPVDVKENELPSEEMYMSGKALYPLSIALAAKLAKEFDGKLRISYSGGADAFHIAEIVEAGIWPVTVATTLLKPGGYQRCEQLAKLSEQAGGREFSGVDPEAAGRLAENARTDARHVKAVKPLENRKRPEAVPLTDCFEAPCEEGCPIHQDITAYMKLAAEGRYLEALRVITEKNPLPFITGTLCAHYCMGKCTRNFYEEPVNIRGVKLECAYQAYDEWMQEIKPSPVTSTKKIAVIGGGPAGLSAAYFLRRGGAAVTIFEKTGKLGGVVRHGIPRFRISEEAVEKDAALAAAMGVEIRLNEEVKEIRSLKEQGYTEIVAAVGASKPGVLKLAGGDAMNALDFLESFNRSGGTLTPGKNVAVIGGGNTAMDAARAAVRAAGVSHVTLVYRRTKRQMPAEEEEFKLALADGVEFRELLAPVSWNNGILICDKMKLGGLDAGGRRSAVPAGGQVQLLADLVIGATGEQVDTEFFEQNGIPVDRRGRAWTEDQTYRTGQEGVYVIGDAWQGPSTVVKAIRDAKAAAEAILGKTLAKDFVDPLPEEEITSRRGILKAVDEIHEAHRCLNCQAICENCVEVCPNRANVSIRVPGMEKHQIIHVDRMCNECGNCRSFCPYSSAPYRDKFTLFANREDLENSENQGFAVLDVESGECLIRYLGEVFAWKLCEPDGRIPGALVRLMETVCSDYRYLL